MTAQEFEQYYSNVSSSIDDDDYFELMMRNAWHISGGEGWCANSSNKRVLVTHADGSQTVEEVKNDLGVKVPCPVSCPVPRSMSCPMSCPMTHPMPTQSPPNAIQADDKATLAQRLRAQGSDVASISLNDGVDTTKGQVPRRQQAWGEVPAGTHTTVPHVRPMAERKVCHSSRRDSSLPRHYPRHYPRCDPSVAIRRSLPVANRPPPIPHRHVSTRTNSLESRTSTGRRWDPVRRFR